MIESNEPLINAKKIKLTRAYSCPSKVHPGNFPLSHHSKQDEPKPKDNH